MIALVSPAYDASGEEGGAERVPARQPERDVRRAERHVQPELVADEADRLERRHDGLRIGADGHRERVDDDVLERDLLASVDGVDEPLADLEPLLRRLGDPGLVVDEADDRRAVLLHERQHALEPLLLAGDRVDERLPLVGGEPGLERLDDRRVDADRQVGVLLDEP